MDVGGELKYNHKEWIDHRMDIERMKSSASVIAESLSNFAKCLRETELPNDVDTTERILQIQSGDRDAIKEDFRIAIRKGLTLLRHIRQAEEKPHADELSPTRYHNVTAVERMLVQLEETERSFDTFWEKHRQRLTNCLQQRRFEERFRKLQSNFAKHMIYLEEHREVGDSVERAEILANEHKEYIKMAKEDVEIAQVLRKEGDELINNHLQDNELSGSLLPKCDELTRMAEALQSALDRRAEVLQLSMTMHRQISEANKWCKAGVQLLSNIPIDINPTSISTTISKMDEFLMEGSKLQLEPFNAKQTMNSLILLTTTETSTLLAQVAERIDDIRRMGVARRDALLKYTEREIKKPVQIVSPEKSLPSTPAKEFSKFDGDKIISSEKDIEIVNDFQQCTVVEDMPSTTNFSLETENHRDTNGIASFVLAELMSTEQSYVRELASIVDYYIIPFENLENTNTLPLPIRGKSSLIFGNLRNLLDYHNNIFLSALMTANNDIPTICRLFISERNHLLSLYRPYCQNKSQSETFRREYVEGKKFFNDCQRRAKHLLPLSAYLLKPIQRITKYQLLLKELSRHCDVVYRTEVETAIAAMLDLLSQLNADMQQLRISGFNGDLSLLGCLRLHTECEVMSFKKKNHRFGKSQRRFILLFDHGVVLCKKRNQPITLDSEYYEFKLLIPLKILGFSEFSKAGSDKFEIWDNSKNEGFAITILDDHSRMKWIQRIGKFLQIVHENKVTDTQRVSIEECHINDNKIQNDDFDGKGIQRNGRPQSWTSVDSTASSKVSSEEGIFAIDPNGNRSSIASIDESNEDELFDSRDIVDNNSSASNHVTTIMVPSTEQENEISSNNSKILDARSISEGQLQTMNGGIVVSESADCVSAAC